MNSDLAERFDPLGTHLDDPYPLYAEARRREPVFYSPRVDAWVVTRFRDVDAILKDPDGFSSADSLRPIRQLYPATFAALAEGYPPKPDHITSDGAAHRRLRAPYAQHLTTPGLVKGMEPAIRGRADALVDGFADAGSADLVARYTAPLPVETAGELFGFAPADVATARSGSEALFRLGGATLTEPEETHAARTFVAFQRLLADYVRRRRAAPTGDLISNLVAALAPGDGPLTFDEEAELVGTISSTFGASHITTTDTIGNALRMLLGHPDQWALLCRRPELVPGAVEEVLRFEAPVPTLRRRATRTATVAGVAVPEGADVLLAFASANRDEERYPDAGRFDITRTPARHFGFGAGVHACVGAAPARAQARIALLTLVERLPGLRLSPDGAVPIRKSINIRGPLAMVTQW
jgi:hypothetical protein